MSEGESSHEAFARGVTAGEVAEQLRRHDTHFSQINGSIDRTAAALEGLRLDVQGLRDQMKADQKTVVVTAQALKDEGQARRDKSDTNWVPVARLFAVVAAIGTALGIYLTARG